MEHSIKFEVLDNHAERFFSILPQDWQSGIVPFWFSYKHDTSIYVLKDKDIIVGGGLLFSTCPPDLLNYEREAQKWFDKGYSYIGFLWISENYRNQQLGSYWIKALKKTLINHKLWLIIEDERLHDFYKRNGFILEKKIQVNGYPEWLYVYNLQTNQY